MDVGLPVTHAGVRYNCRAFLLRRKVLLLRENVDKLGEVRSQSFWCALRASLALRRSSPSSAAS